MLFHPFPNAFGLDIGDLNIKLVQCVRRGSKSKLPVFDLQTVKSISIPPGLIVNGELMQPEKVRSYLSHLLSGEEKKGKPVRSSWVVASLPETQSFIKLLTLNKEEKEVIVDDILLVAEKHIPFEKEKYYLDWQIIPQEEKQKTAVLVAAIPNLIADSYTYLLESMNLAVLALEVEAVSIARAMITVEKVYSKESRAILDLGAIRSSLIVYDHNTIQFSTTIPYSGEILNTLLTQKFHVTYEEAEKIKLDYGLQADKNNKYWTEMIKLTDQLVLGINKAIDFYYSHFAKANKITHITMCGGLSNFLGLSEYLTKALEIETLPGNVWKNLHTKKPIDVDKSKSLSYATAIGLALRAADYDNNGGFI